MARKVKHEEHVNHEAWAIPYGDLITLLLAFFVVMYAVSSINEGKMRVLSDAMVVAFGGPPRALQPIDIGDHSPRRAVREQSVDLMSITRPIPHPAGIQADLPMSRLPPQRPTEPQVDPQLAELGAEIERKLAELVAEGSVRVHRGKDWLEIEIKADILFPSGSSVLTRPAQSIIAEISGVLAEFAYPLRIEGHTDNLPIATTRFPSNWELSAARAGSVVHMLRGGGVAPERMTLAGFGPYRPVDGNDTAEGRNRNRRVTIIVLGDDSVLVPRVGERS